MHMGNKFLPSRDLRVICRGPGYEDSPLEILHTALICLVAATKQGMEEWFLSYMMKMNFSQTKGI